MILRFAFWNPHLVADRLAEKREISAVYISDLKRARDTAHHQIIFSFSFSSVLKIQRYEKRHLGDLQGFSMREAAKLKVDANKASLSSRADQEIPVRLVKVLINIFTVAHPHCRKSEGSIKVYPMRQILSVTLTMLNIFSIHIRQRLAEFTHGGVSKAFHKRAAPTAELPSKIQNASISIFEIADEEGWTIKPGVVSPNQARTIYQALKKKDLPVALVEYEGQQHGFCKMKSIQSKLTILTDHVSKYLVPGIFCVIFCEYCLLKNDFFRLTRDISQLLCRNFKGFALII
ncbi:hypothetical protein GH714_013837 [Hevea brasiliensis]|uniref:Peptidase S9 prolyl oligopeptidase catalytic domain-containing protein n=1 Tax=Hevea brasiliensis TaxID=3981 RepID=A0A6A6NGZ3_HEVBR|nr:hypothetical protein GH714_013837 [Hevea brasiliensis]